MRTLLFLLTALMLAGLFPCKLRAQDNTLTFTMHTWQHGNETLHGVAVTGDVLHRDPAKGRRTVQMLLMPAGHFQGGAMQNPRLEFNVLNEQRSNGSHQLIDLVHGAAYVKLLPLVTSERNALSAALENFLESKTELRVRIVPDPAEPMQKDDDRDNFDAEGEAAPEGKADPEGDAAPGKVPQPKLILLPPPDLDALIAAVRRLGGAAEGFQPNAEQEVPITQSQAIALVYRYWPMIVTHSVVAAAEGTKVMMVTLAEDQPANITHRTKIHLIKTTQVNEVEASWPDANNPAGHQVALVKDKVVRLDIENDGPAQNDSTVDPDPAVTHLKARLKAGIKTAFP